ncbi:sterile alpha motif domain-containing protein 11 isoform X1, partial [Tachysurus ichikawai]
NRGRLAEKRTIPLPPTRVPKKELASVFSSDESEGGERSSTDHADIKQEEELHYTTMRKTHSLLHVPAVFESQELVEPSKLVPRCCAALIQLQSFTIPPATREAQLAALTAA